MEIPPKRANNDLLKRIIDLDDKSERRPARN